MTLENIIGDEKIHKQAKHGDDNPAKQEQIRAAHSVEDGLHRVIEGRGIQMQHICKASARIQQQGGNDIPYNGECNISADCRAETMLVEQSADGQASVNVHAAVCDIHNAKNDKQDGESNRMDAAGLCDVLESPMDGLPEAGISGGNRSEHQRNEQDAEGDDAQNGRNNHPDGRDKA